jgi:hypothetical protein
VAVPKPVSGRGMPVVAIETYEQQRHARCGYCCRRLACTPMVFSMLCSWHQDACVERVVSFSSVALLCFVSLQAQVTHLSFYAGLGLPPGRDGSG